MSSRHLKSEKYKVKNIPKIIHTNGMREGKKAGNKFNAQSLLPLFATVHFISLFLSHELH